MFLFKTLCFSNKELQTRLILLNCDYSRIIVFTLSQLAHELRSFHYDYCELNDVIATSLIHSSRYAANLNKFIHTHG